MSSMKPMQDAMAAFDFAVTHGATANEWRRIGGELRLAVRASMTDEQIATAWSRADECRVRADAIAGLF